MSGKGVEVTSEMIKAAVLGLIDFQIAEIKRQRDRAITPVGRAEAQAQIGALNRLRKSVEEVRT